MNASAIPTGRSHIRRDGGGDEGGDGGRDGGTDFFGGPGRAGAMRCQMLTNGIRLLVSSVGGPRATPSSGARHGRRDAHAAPLHSALGSRLAVAGSDGIMLLSGVPARARRVWRRLGARCCRHKVALPIQSSSPVAELVGRRPSRGTCTCHGPERAPPPPTLVHFPSQPHPGRVRNDQSRMSPSPQPIASLL
jgi:hypothetical protein